MKIHVIGTPYSGALIYATQLAQDLDAPFFNEPYKFNNTAHSELEGPVQVGGGIPESCEDYVACHTPEQYSQFGSFTSDCKLIFVDRRDRWTQFLLYLANDSLYETYLRKYNIEYTPHVIEPTDNSFKNFTEELASFNFLSNKFSDGKTVYYEDIKTRSDTKIFQPININKLEFKNISKIKKYYNDNIRDREKRRVIFIVQSEMTWNGFRGIYRELENNPRYEPIVVIIPQVYDTAAVQEKIWDWTTEHTRKVLTDENIPFFNLALIGDQQERVAYLKKLNSEYALISTKDDWYIKHFFGLTCKDFAEHLKIIYIPYYGATSVEVDQVHTQGKGHQSYWKIIVDSPLYADLFIKEDPKNADRLINVGHPKIEEIYKIRQTKGRWPLPNSENKLKVIWAPHWSCPEFPNWDYLGGRPNRMKLGTFWKNCWDFYEYAKNNQDKVQFVFRPHPLLQVHSKLHGWFEYYENFVNEWSKLPNVYNEMAGLYNDTFAASDIMITEGISFLIEYPIATAKPLIVIENPEGCKFNEIGQMALNYANRVSSFNEIRYLLDFPNNLTIGDSVPILNYLIPYREDTSKKIISTIETMLLEE